MPHRKSVLTCLLLPALLALGAANASAQLIRPEDRQAIMQTWARSLGVKCQYCHSAARGTNDPQPKKDIARQMFIMMMDVNAKIEAATGKHEGDVTKVECVTCHRGIAVPGQLTDILTKTYRDQGTAGVAAQYKDLKKEYFGRQAYDFGEDTLITVAHKLSSNMPKDAITLLKLNLDTWPQSVRSYMEMGYAYSRLLDEESAVEVLEKALAIEPENGVIQGQIQQLKAILKSHGRQ